MQTKQFHFALKQTICMCTLAYVLYVPLILLFKTTLRQRPQISSWQSITKSLPSASTQQCANNEPDHTEFLRPETCPRVLRWVQVHFLFKQRLNSVLERKIQTVSALTKPVLLCFSTDCKIGPLVSKEIMYVCCTEGRKYLLTTLKEAINITKRQKRVHHWDDIAYEAHSINAKCKGRLCFFLIASPLQPQCMMKASQQPVYGW